jgi:hypothetical protein
MRIRQVGDVDYLQSCGAVGNIGKITVYGDIPRNAWGIT